MFKHCTGADFMPGGADEGNVSPRRCHGCGGRARNLRVAAVHARPGSSMYGARANGRCSHAGTLPSQPASHDSVQVRCSPGAWHRSPRVEGQHCYFPPVRLQYVQLQR